MAKKDKKPKKLTQKPAAKAKPAKKAAKPAPKAVKTAKPAKPTPKTVAKAVSEKPAKVAAKPVKDAKKKKGKNPDDSDFEDFEEDLSFEGTSLLEDFKNKSPEEIEELRQLLGESVQADEDEVEIALRDAEGRLYCRMRECDELATVDGYCRFHYLKLWKRIQLRKKILTDGKLEKYIEELTLRYPDKYIEMIREDLKSEKGFLAAIQELEIEDIAEDTESEEDDTLLEEVRGIQSANTDDGDDGF